MEMIVTNSLIIIHGEDVSYYLDSNNYLSSIVDSLQFLKLLETTILNPDEVNNRILSEKGILSGLASALIKSENTYGIKKFI